MVSQYAERHGQAGLTLITNTLMLRKVVDRYLSNTHLPIMFDTETTGLNPRTLLPISLQFKQLGKEPVVVDVRIMPRKLLRDILEPLFDGRILIVGTNLKYDYQVMMQCYGVRMKRVYDCQLAEQVIWGLGLSDGRNRGVGFNLKAVAERYGLSVSKEERNWFADLDKREEWVQPFPPEQLNYMSQDVEVLEPIYLKQIEKLKEQNKTKVAKLEMRVLPAIAEAELNGVLLNTEGWMNIIREKEEEARQLEEEVLGVYAPAILQKRSERFDNEWVAYHGWEVARDTYLQQLKNIWSCGVEHDGWGEYKTSNMKNWRERYPNPGKPKADTSIPNIGSTHQLLDAFEVLGIPLKSTGSDVLEQYKDEHEAIDLLLKWRKAIKFVQSFGQSLIDKVDVDGRIHPDYIQIGASSRRMSCTHPNWQQVPSKGDGKRLRACVVADKGHRLLVCDFSSQELLILANESGDTSMVRAFREGLDLHSATARLMFNLPEDVDPKKHEISKGVSARTAAKTINYGIVYGMGPGKLAKSLSIPNETAKDLISRWYAAYPDVTKYLNKQMSDATRNMKATALDGWTRYFSLQSEPSKPKPGSTKEDWNTYHEKLSEWKQEKSRIERQGKNTPIQAAGAGMTKLAVALFHERNEYLTGVKVIAVVHDEIVVEAEEEYVGYAKLLLSDSMDEASRTYCSTVSVPVTVDDVTVSTYWSKE